MKSSQPVSDAATRLNVVSPDLALSEMQARLLDQGYLIIEDLAGDLARQACRELTPHIEEAPFGHDEFLGAKTKRLGGILQDARALAAVTRAQGATLGARAAVPLR